uniref:Transmembrane 4 L six family member 5 n=1 Tax=Eptatretus burgeri TaxID=7764 RepID=A0A8C4WXT1_EPTBU
MYTVICCGTYTKRRGEGCCKVIWLNFSIPSDVLSILQMFIPSCFFQSTGDDGCCGNRCGMFCSILFSAIGFLGALYCFAVSITGMVEGPKCNNSIDHNWSYPFSGSKFNISESYLFHQETWSTCSDPPNVVMWNVVLFSMLIIFGGIEMILCVIQIINGIFGTICGNCISVRTFYQSYTSSSD